MRTYVLSPNNPYYVSAQKLFRPIVDNTSPTARLLESTLKGHHVLWVSSKATDSFPSLRFGSSSSFLSLIGSGTLECASRRGLSLEEIIDRRVDYDRSSWDELDAASAEKFVSHIVNVASKKEVLLVPFAASMFLSNINATVPGVILAGNQFYLERSLEYKPWIEYEFRKCNIATVPWTNIIPGYNGVPNDAPAPLLLRAPVSSGGLGHALYNSSQTLLENVKFQSGADIFSVCPYLEHTCSMNVSACVFKSGRITQHPLSLQIIGSPECTDRRFGYCGNDFGAAKRFLDDDDITSIELVVRKVGSFLWRLGYLGAYGLDLLKSGKHILVSELNPRFQASTLPASLIAAYKGMPDLYTDHIAAHLGLEPQEDRPSLSDLIDVDQPLAQVFCYNAARENIEEPLDTSLSFLTVPFNIDLLPTRKKIDPHGLLFRIFISDVVLQDGRNLNEVTRNTITAISRSILELDGI